MVMSVLGAVLVGAVASVFLPFLPFAAALSLAALVGAVWTVAQGHPALAAGCGALELLVGTQAGYGFGLLLAAALDHRSARAARLADTAAERGRVHDLRFGKES